MCGIISKNNKNISKCFTSTTGRPHAEEIALKKAGIKAEGATMYVTLEPCFHSSQNGSCTDQILRSGIKEVYVSCIDHDPRTKNKSISKLKRNKIKVIVGIQKDKTLSTNNFFFKSLIISKLLYAAIPPQIINNIFLFSKLFMGN